LFVNVTVEKLAPCKKLVRVEVDAQQVDATFDSITKDFQREAVLPGFRPGKAPRDMVLRKYEKSIQDEVKRKLISDSYRKAVDEQKLDVLGYPDIEEIQFQRGQPLQFAATIETAPEFELPEYKGLAVKREIASVTAADVDSALDVLRQQQQHFHTLDRPAQSGDFVVVNYTATTEGKPLSELTPNAKSLTERKAFWIELQPGSFLPGFAEQLSGAKAGDHRQITVDFPADFLIPELAGKKGVYEVDVVEVKEKHLPALDEAFAKSLGAANPETLQAGVQRDLENELKLKQNRAVRNQLLRSLLDRVNFDLPESSVAQETRNVVYDIVQENAKRGIRRETIEQQKEQIYAAATQGAKERVKIAFLLQRIAEKEDIKVAQEEIGRRITHLAGMYGIEPEKFAKDLQKRNGLIEIYDQVMNEKVIDLLQQNAKIEDVAPAAAPAPEANPGPEVNPS
jgi:trigger factor